MFDLAIKVIILVLALEAVALVLVLVGWLGTLTQKNMREAEAAEAQKKAWVSSNELNKALKVNIEDTKKANEEAISKILMNTVVTKDGFSSPSISH